MSSLQRQRSASGWKPDSAAFERRWRDEMRSLLPGIAEDRLTELYEDACRLGREAAKAVEGE